MAVKKYADGTRLTLTQQGWDELPFNEQREYEAGEMLIVRTSKDHPSSYDFLGKQPAGWVPRFVETPEYFKKSVKEGFEVITTWT